MEGEIKGEYINRGGSGNIVFCSNSRMMLYLLILLLIVNLNNIYSFIGVPINKYQYNARRGLNAKAIPIIWIVEDDISLLDATSTYLIQQTDYNIYKFTSFEPALSIINNINIKMSPQLIIDEDDDKDNRNTDKNTDKNNDKDKDKNDDDSNKEKNTQNTNKAPNNLPNCIISDIQIPGKMSGLDFLRKIRDHPKEKLRNTPVVLLTARGMTDDRIKGYSLGANAYLPKVRVREKRRTEGWSEATASAIFSNISSPRFARNPLLVASLRSLLRSSQPFSPEELTAILNNLVSLSTRATPSSTTPDRDAAPTSPPPASSIPPVTLTPREEEVLKLISGGLTNKEISSSLFVSVRTVERYASDMFKKTGTNRRTELVRWGIKYGYVDI